MKNAKEIQNDFNRKAEELGCRARISGTVKKPKFERFTGGYTSDGYEIVRGIDYMEFARLIADYPVLQND